MVEFRYNHEARLFDESLAEIQVASPKVAAEPSYGGLDRIANGQTALAQHESAQEHAAHGAHADVQKHELKKKLVSLLNKDRQKAAARDLVLDHFMSRVTKLANPNSPDLGVASMTSGVSAGTGDKPAPVRSNGADQGPAADFFAQGLKELRKHDAVNRASASNGVPGAKMAGRVSLKKIKEA